MVSVLILLYNVSAYNILFYYSINFDCDYQLDPIASARQESINKCTTKESKDII